MTRPPWDADVIRENRARLKGAAALTAAGWLACCPECPAEVVTAEALPTWRTIGPHMVEAHGAPVPGINVGILA